MVHRVVLLFNHIHTLHFRHIHTLHLNLFTPKVVTTQVEGTTPPIQLKLHQGWKKNEWACDDEKFLVLLNFIISLSFIWSLCCTYKVGFHVHVWLKHSVDCIEGNAKPEVKFWGAIADTYNSTTDLHHQWTPKNLKDHCCACNKQLSDSIKFTIKNLPPSKAESLMTWFLRPQSSGTRIRLVLNSSASTDGKLWGIN
jgi:hypothetical protein